MRLGIAQWSYQWFLTPSPLWADRGGAAYGYRGLGRPYFITTPLHVSQATPSDPIEWLITRCGQLGVQVCHGNITRWDDQAHLDGVKGLLEQHKLELIPANGANLIGTGDEVKRSQEACIANLERYHRFGGVRISKCNGPITHGHFSREIPVDEQLRRIVENITPIVNAASQLGIVIALENHYDFRAAEIRSVIEQVNSGNLRSLFDVGSPFAVCEEPVEAAKTLAPYVVLVHLKDCFVQPWTPTSPGYYSCQYAVPLGEGHVDLKQITQILQANAPDPKRLCLALELVPIPPEQDEDRWVAEGVRWVREHLPEYLNG